MSFLVLMSDKFDPSMKTETNKANWMSIVSLSDATMCDESEDITIEITPPHCRHALEYLAEFYPDDRDALQAVADGIWIADSLHYTVRWHLRYFMVNPYITEHLKVNREISYEILWDKYLNADNERKKMLYLYSALSTHQMTITEELYKEVIDGLLNTDVRVLRKFLFELLFVAYNMEEIGVDKSMFEYGYEKIKAKKDELLQKHGLKDEDIPIIVPDPSFKAFEKQYPVLADFGYFEHLASNGFEKLMDMGK